MLIINADDFGANHGVNLAVVAAFQHGLCSSCSIMPNMPGFKEACEFVQLYALQSHVGLHLTLTEGVPVTERIRGISMFCDGEGRFVLSRQSRVVGLPPNARQALKEEIQGQVALCREHGIPITHVDSHSHVHEEWALASLVIEVALGAKIPYVRIVRSFGPGTAFLKRAYRRIINLRLRSAGLAATRYFGTPADYRLFCRRLGGSGSGAASWEVMVHPDLDDNQQVLVDRLLKRPLEDVLADLPGREEAVSYACHRYDYRLVIR
jgi:chitin disaccharide deacetylase